MTRAWMRTQKVKNARSHAIGFIQSLHHFSIFVSFAFHELVSQLRFGISANWGRNDEELRTTYWVFKVFSWRFFNYYTTVVYIQVPNYDDFLYRTGFMFCLTQAMDTRRK